MAQHISTKAARLGQIPKSPRAGSSSGDPAYGELGFYYGLGIGASSSFHNNYFWRESAALVKYGCMQIYWALLNTYPRSPWLKRSLILLYLAAHAFPFLAVRRYRETMEFFNIGASRWDINLILVLLPFMVLLELAVLWLLAGWLRGRSLALSRRREIFLSFLVFLAALFPCAAYFAWIVGSWTFYSFTGTFPGLESLNSILVLMGPINFLREITLADKILLCGAAGCSLLCAIAVTILLPPLSSSRSFTQALTHILFLGSIIIAGSGFVRVRLSKDGLATLQPLAASYLSPGVSLYLSAFFFTQIDQLEEFVLDKRLLQESYSIEQHSQIAATGNGKNVLLVIIEALRRDAVGKTAAGKEITPTLNDLARNGINFERAYAQSPETGYSQRVIHTGQFPLRLSTRDPGRNFTHPHAKIYDLLSLRGYRTAYIAAEWALDRGVLFSERLDLYLDPQTRSSTVAQHYFDQSDLKINPANVPTAVLDQLTARVLKNWLADGDPKKPFFASLYLYSSHFPYEHFSFMGEPLFDETALPADPNFFGYPSDYSAEMLKRYWNTLNYIDGLIADLLEFLRSNKLIDDTVIIVTGDHGELFGEHGAVTHASLLHEEVLRVPLIIFDSAQSWDPALTTRPAGHIDIAPTILDLLNLPVYGGYQGASVRKKHREDCPLFSTVQTAVFEDALVIWPWKYVRNFRGGFNRLYNLQTDEHERDNLIDKSANKAAGLARTLNEYRQSQLAYHSLPEAERQKLFPPVYDECR